MSPFAAGIRGLLKYQLRLYIGALDRRGKNFYKDCATRIGCGETAEMIQRLYLAGKRGAAITVAPDKLVDALHLVSPKKRIRERFAAWQRSPVTTMLVSTVQPDAIRLIAELNG